MSVYRRNYARENGAQKSGFDVWAYDFSFRRVRCRQAGFATRAEALLAESVARERLVMHGKLPTPPKEIRFSNLCQQFIANRG